VRVARKLLTARPLSIFFTGSNTFPSKSVSIECVRSRLKKILKVERCRAPRPDPPGTLRDQPLVERAPGARSRCMQAKHPWRLRSALAPLLLDGNVRRGYAPVSVANHDRNSGDGRNLARPGPISRHAISVADRASPPTALRTRAGGRRDLRTRRIPSGGNLVRIVRTFEPFPEPKSVRENSIS
jgi:hypothetical protein